MGFGPTRCSPRCETATRGTRVAQIFEGSRATDVVRHRRAREARPPGGSARRFRSPRRRAAQVELGQVADVARTTGRFVIAHVGARRVQTVTANVRGRDVESVTRDLERGSAPSAVCRPACMLRSAAQARRSAQARRELLRDSLLAGAGIVMLLWVAFGEASRLLLVLANLPFALVGGVLAVFATGGLLSRWARSWASSRCSASRPGTPSC